MSVSRDMLAMWWRPAVVVARQLAQGVREERALAVLLAGCLLMFVSELPVLQRQAVEAGAGDAGAGDDFLRGASYAFMAWMMLAPLVLYGLAAAGRLGARVFRLRTTGYGARFALFWALLCAAPAVLLYGLTLGLVGPGPAAQVVGAVWIAAFVIFWTIGLRVAGQRGQDA